ncbi:stage V sporulation protein R [Alicyclobacillus cellulosilyticus]|uniref:Stage V sporulation protein R n=1 Tax=Alicyclobacillus cellulosilyticus TaxID=1003997 RepID=A0A917NNF8_9BACL|nr:SpoVR family protein [Alicyclobacillus cellulosilyticus]GGJ13825.1 stage V sporulation protein R [Alicyclobacillus cellulosilyticus]
MNPREMAELERSIEQMMDIAERNGLDFYPMRFEVCPSDVLYTFGAYGMPTRFSHWSFGKQYHRLKMEYDLGLSRIYELVINSNPCYAFLLDGNTLIQNKTVCAHVLGHADFFKNNAHFAGTARDMMERMAANAERIRRYELEYGRARVEKLLDAGLALQEHVDASRHGQMGRRWRERRQRAGDRALADDRPARRSGPYDDLWALDGRAAGDAVGQAVGGGAAVGGAAGGAAGGNVAAGGISAASTVAGGKEAERGVRLDRGGDERWMGQKKPPYPEKDLMLFLIEHSHVLEEWERDVLSVLREEMLYFWPQLETKIMNEGWATYWHLRIMRELDLTEAEAVEFAKMHAGVVLPSRMSINPYHLGLAIWEHIEKRWNEPTKEERERYGRQPGQGRAKMFEVRETESDVSFLRNYLTKELIEELDLYLYQKVGNEWRVVETDWEKVRDHLVASRVNGGIPVLYVEDGDHNKSGELYIRHAYEGVELDLKHLEKVLPYLVQLWGKPCHLQTVVEGRDVVFTCDGKRTQRRFL